MLPLGKSKAKAPINRQPYNYSSLFVKISTIVNIYTKSLPGQTIFERGHDGFSFPPHHFGNPEALDFPLHACEEP